MLASAAAKEEGLGHERIQPEAPAAGKRSKEEWEQPSSTLVGPGNVAVKHEGSCNKRPDKQREDEQKWEREWVVPKKGAAQSAGSQPHQGATETAGFGQRAPRQGKVAAGQPKKNEMANNMFSNDSRLVSPKSSVLLERCETKRSVASSDSGHDWVRGLPVGLAHDLHNGDGRRCNSGVPLNTNTGWNSKGSSVAYSGHGTRSATQASNYRRAPQQRS